ncbi:hypothetical protein RyT2_10980 [Pseudolactococcus yaeyamensis]
MIRKKNRKKNRMNKLNQEVLRTTKDIMSLFGNMFVAIMFLLPLSSNYRVGIIFLIFLFAVFTINLLIFIFYRFKDEKHDGNDNRHK